MAPSIGLLTGWQLDDAGAGTVIGLIVVVMGVFSVWSVSTARAPIRQRNEYVLLFDTLNTAAQDKGGTVTRLFVIQKVEDMVKGSFMRRTETGQRSIKDEADAKDAKESGQLGYHVQLHFTAIPTRLIERVHMVVLGTNIPAQDWESRVYEGFDRVAVDFVVPETLPSGLHTVTFTAHSENAEIPSEEYQVAFP